jgi:hypothetical protein
MPLPLIELPHLQQLLRLLNAPLLVQLICTSSQLHLVRTAVPLQLLCTPPLAHLLRPAEARLLVMPSNIAMVSASTAPSHASFLVAFGSKSNSLVVEAIKIKQ